MDPEVVEAGEQTTEVTTYISEQFAQALSEIDFNLNQIHEQMLVDSELAVKSCQTDVLCTSVLLAALGVICGLIITLHFKGK